jgi:hypothetical protein
VRAGKEFALQRLTRVSAPDAKTFRADQSH